VQYLLRLLFSLVTSAFFLAALALPPDFVAPPPRDLLLRLPAASFKLAESSLQFLLSDAFPAPDRLAPGRLVVKFTISFEGFHFSFLSFFFLEEETLLSFLFSFTS